MSSKNNKDSISQLIKTVKEVLYMKEYQTINFSPSDKHYYPASLEEEYEFLREDDSYIKHTEIDIPLGKSRYGGPIIDLPEGFERPANMRFAAQLDLAEIAKHDKQSRLPTSGQLIFFADIVTDNCHVVYSDTPNNALQRIIDEHDDNFFSGVLINEMSSATETWQDHFREVDEMELECGECGEEDFRNCECNCEYNDFTTDEISSDNKVWDSFAGCNQSEMFGFFSHCQWSKEEIEEVAFSDKVVLLQIGENGFNDEGAFIVLIENEALKNRDFSECECLWAQT